MRIIRGLALLVALCAAREGWSGELALSPLGGPVRRGALAELRLSGIGEHANPFDPAEVRADGEVVGPSGKKSIVPAFLMTPHKAVRPPDEGRAVKHMRVFFGTSRWRAGERISLLLDDLVLVDTDTGERVVLDDFEGPPKWQAQRADVAVERRRAHGGKQALRLSVTVDRQHKWPGMGWQVGLTDWSRFEELRLWACPLAGLTENLPVIEYYTPTGRKFQAPIRALEGAKPGEWCQFIWKLPSSRPPLAWQPAGEPQWRLRLRPQEAGLSRCRVRVEDAKGTRYGPWQELRVADASTDGYLRLSAKDPRYLAFDSGKPFFAVGINLLGRDLDTYRHYVGKLAACGGNFIRIWLSPRTMGIETKQSGPRSYAQDKAAQLDALFELCAEKGIYVMACISDFREVNAGRGHSLWQESPYNAANGGPCERPEDFFTDPKAKEQYRAKLRYLVARYGHSPHVHSWEFFNEVNITNGWRTAPDTVRAWHREMAAYLRKVDPQGHAITSSFAGIEDDTLWEQPLMEIVQRHQYIDGQRSFARLVADAHGKLRRHRKPILMGEFGRRRNRFAALDRRGVSLHNGMWSAILAGGCGTAMSWWWQWIDEQDLWPQFRSVATFIGGIDWPAEAFEPSIEAKVAARPHPKHGFGPISFAPQARGFKPGPHNQPVTLRVTAAGQLDSPEKLPGILHGLRNHPDLHNPVTLRVEMPTAGHFEVSVDGVSGHGGAALEFLVDGEPAHKHDFPDTAEDNRTMRQYNGAYRVPVPAGTHTATVRNTGRDWVIVARYSLSTARPTPPIQVMSLRGRQTTLVWAWNQTHAWYQPVARTLLLPLEDVSVTLEKLRPGRYRVRPFAPWSGAWGREDHLTVGADGQARLAVGRLASDAAFRLERTGGH